MKYMQDLGEVKMKSNDQQIQEPGAEVRAVLAVI
jgi:hypothetical protein